MSLQHLIFIKSFTFIFLFMLLTQVSYSQDFITQWTFADTTTKIRFSALTTDIVYYTWTTSHSGNSGSGHFIKTTPGEVLLSGLSVEPDEIVIINMAPEHLSRFYFEPFSRQDNTRLIAVLQWGEVSWTSMSKAFFDCQNLIITAVDNPDLTHVSQMDSMFCFSGDYINSIENWDVSSVTDMSFMFYDANSFNQAIKYWDVSNVTDMKWMFAETRDFNQDIGIWDVSNVTDMSYMFYKTFSFNENIGHWRSVENVTDMSFMFYDAESFDQDIGIWDVSNVTDMKYMFFGVECFNQDIGNWNVEKVTDMAYMFFRAESFNHDIGSWDVSNVTNMEGMFAETHDFNQDIGNWNIGNVTDISRMFYGAKSFNQDIGSWDVSDVTNMEFMFTYCLSCISPFNQDLGSWDVSNVTNMNGMFLNAKSFNQDLGEWDVSNVSNLRAVFSGAKSFNQDLGAWKLHPEVDMYNMLNNSAMDCDHYSATLVEWQENNPSVTDVTLGARGVQFGTIAVEARDTLINLQGWTIKEDEASNMACDELVSTTFVPSRDRHQLAIYPNPTSGQITIKDSQFEFEYLRVINSLGRDLTGEVIIRQESGTSATVDLSGLPVGMYFLQTAGGSGVVYKE